MVVVVDPVSVVEVGPGLVVVVVVIVVCGSAGKLVVSVVSSLPQAAARRLITRRSSTIRLITERLSVDEEYRIRCKNSSWSYEAAP